jgi:hypothetical protein
VVVNGGPAWDLNFQFFQAVVGWSDRHVALAQTPGAGADAIRAAVVNPARLSPVRQMEPLTKSTLLFVDIGLFPVKPDLIAVLVKLAAALSHHERHI